MEWEGGRGDEPDVKDFWEGADTEETWLLPSDLEDNDPRCEDVNDLPLGVDFGELGVSYRLAADTLDISGRFDPLV